MGAGGAHATVQLSASLAEGPIATPNVLLACRICFESGGKLKVTSSSLCFATPFDECAEREGEREEEGESSSGSE